MTTVMRWRERVQLQRYGVNNKESTITFLAPRQTFAASTSSGLARQQFPANEVIETVFLEA